MKAEIFLKDGNEPAAVWLREAVEEYIGPGLPMEVLALNAGALRDNLASGARYSQLLQASIPPELGLQLEVRSLDWLGDRIYIRVYWPVFAGFYWGYPRYSQAEVPFFPHQFDTFFPALAVRDRMLLVPGGQTQVLENVPPGEAAPQEIVNRDLLEVDFTDQQAVRDAVRTASLSLANQLKAELGAWSRYRPPGGLDLAAAARDLDVQPPILQRLLSGEVADAQKLYSKVTADFDHTRLVTGRWSRITVTVQNRSDQDLTRLKVDVAGPVDVRPSSTITDIPARASTTVQIALRSADPGEFPVEITLVREDDALVATWMPPLYIWLEATEP